MRKIIRIIALFIISILINLYSIPGLIDQKIGSDIDLSLGLIKVENINDEFRAKLESLKLDLELLEKNSLVFDHSIEVKDYMTELDLDSINLVKEREREDRLRRNKPKGNILIYNEDFKGKDRPVSLDDDDEVDLLLFKIKNNNKIGVKI